MFALARLGLILFVVLSVIYVSLSLYSRSVRRSKLEAEWTPEQGPQKAFVEEGLREYDSSLRRKLILGVYVVPILLICTIVYLTNFA